jgi:hypothetical protein
VLMEDRERFIVVLNYTRKITRGWMTHAQPQIMTDAPQAMWNDQHQPV